MKGGQCSNCKKEIQASDSYCAQCGQKMIQKVSFWILLQDIFGNTFNLESKLFRTLGNLIFLPGNLTKAFLVGKHQHYYTPGKLFLFLMAVHFILLGSLLPSLENDSLKKIAYKELGKEEFCSALDSIPALQEHCKTIQYDSIAFQAIYEIREKIAIKDLVLLPVDSVLTMYSITGFWGRLAGQQIIKAVKSPNSLNSYFFNHLSWAILFMIPFLGLLLKLLYRKYYYLDHIVFMLHLHAFVFLLLSFLYLFEHFGWFAPNQVVLLCIIASSIYLSIALKRCYLQKFWKLMIKILLFGIGYMLTFVLIMLFFLFFSLVLFA